jgi:hypothetical protein
MQFDVNIGINDVHNALVDAVRSVFPKKEGGEERERIKRRKGRKMREEVRRNMVG